MDYTGNGFPLLFRESVTIRAVSGAHNLPAGAKPVENSNLGEAYLASMVSRG